MSWLRLTTSCSTQGPLPNARQTGVTAARNAAQAAREADVVISAVTADAMLDVAREA
jgi:3-hydroxyisobutyrate dehydrogenase-like beta-hydroxyacid dehydrogenase